MSFQTRLCREPAPPYLSKDRLEANTHTEVSVDLELPEGAGNAVHRGVRGSHRGAAESLFQGRDRAFARLLRVQLETYLHFIVSQYRGRQRHQLFAP